MTFYAGEANGSSYTCWIWHEPIRWCYRKYNWQGFAPFFYHLRF